MDTDILSRSASALRLSFVASFAASSSSEDGSDILYDFSGADLSKPSALVDSLFWF